MLASLWCLMFGCAATTNANDIFYRCFKLSWDEYNDTASGNAEELITHLDLSLPTVFFIHGFKESCSNDSAIAISSAVLSRGGFNVCCLDWSTYADLDYVSAAANTHDVAATFAKDLAALYALGLPAKEPYLMGFSLGAHVAGFTGANLIAAGYPSLKRITALDAAFPFFYPPTCIDCQHIKSTDADMVDAMHTDGGVYGILEAIGTCDFYANSGIRIQNGCPVLPTTTDIYEILPMYRCSHDRSWEYFEEAIRNENSYQAVACNSSLSFNADSCSGNPRVSIVLNLPSNCSGTYYYQTNGVSPYGRGLEGTYPSTS